MKYVLEKIGRDIKDSLMSAFRKGKYQKRKGVRTVSGKGRLRVDGNRIIDEEGSDITLKGIRIDDPLCMAFKERMYSEKDFDVLRDWGANIVGITIYPGLFEKNSDYLEKYVDPIVEMCEERGMYLLLGWHSHGNAIEGRSEEVEWENSPPFSGNPFNPKKEFVKESLKSISSRYKNRKNLIYGTFNEPTFITWKDWRPVAEELVDAIHEGDPDAIVTVAGVDWGYDLRGAINDPVRRGNVVYETHPYNWKGDKWKDFIPKLSQKNPVLIGEWGLGPKNANDRKWWYNEDRYKESLDYGNELMDTCEEYGIGWTAWIWHYKNTPRMLKNFDTYETTSYGDFVKKQLKR